MSYRPPNQLNVSQLFSAASIPRSTATCVSDMVCAQNVDGRVEYGGMKTYGAGTNNQCVQTVKPLFVVDNVPYTVTGWASTGNYKNAVALSFSPLTG